MKNEEMQGANPLPTPAPIVRLREIEGREWWLWGFAVTVTLGLTLGIVGLTFPGFHVPASDWLNLKEWARGLAALVLIFDIYTLFQHLQLQRMRRELTQRDLLFQLITENAADMIAVVDAEGQRLYNSPSYQKVLGYSAEELNSSSLAQIHPDDRQRVEEAAEKARATGRGEKLEYRIRHKNGSWRILESAASAVQNVKGETTSLVIVSRDITDRKRAEETLAHNAFHDHLTNLPNRALFVDRVQRALALANRHPDYKFAVLFIDVDEFKVLNDSLGHAAGDRLLIGFAQRLTASLRGMDMIARPCADQAIDAPEADNTIARLGGDEFTVLLDEIHDPSDAIRVAQRIQDKWTSPFIIDGQEVVTTASVGIALSTASRTDAEDLVRDAEIAMYRAKQAGKARCELFDPAMHEAAVKRLRLETDLRKALQLREFCVHYQPIISLQSGRIVGVEALTRWPRPSGMVMPSDFIPVADETGLILPMNRLLLADGLQQLRSWHAEFVSETPLYLSINVTAKEFAQPELAADIGLVLQESGMDSSVLQLEITENVTMADGERASRVLSELKALGVRISIDDFGTGYSSLSRLQGLPVDSLKIDRAFISNMDNNSSSREIVRTIILLAHNLGLGVIAEGTETAEQVDQVKQLMCEMAQGYFFSRPVEPQAISALLQRERNIQTAAPPMTQVKRAYASQRPVN
jgi:PAS domain S-box-containing protein